MLQLLEHQRWVHVLLDRKVLGVGCVSVRVENIQLHLVDLLSRNLVSALDDYYLVFATWCLFELDVTWACLAFFLFKGVL